MADERVTLLVPSCDRYADLWPPFFALLRRQWPDCPFPVVVGSNHRPCTETGVGSVCGHRSTAGRLDDEINAGLRRLSPEAVTNALDVLVYLPDEMLAKVDRMTMAASLEARSPLLDLALVQRLAGVAFARKVPGLGRSSLKQVLRAAVGDLLPPEGRDAPKWGFNVPLDPWFRGKARSYLLEHLSPERVARRGVFDPAAVRDVLARFDAGRADANTHVFPLLVFELWAEQYLDH